MNPLKFIIVLVLVVTSCEGNSSERNDFRHEGDSIKSLANIAYEQNHFEVAAQNYTRLLQSDSLNGEFYYKRGYCYAQLNQDHKAVSDFQKSYELNYRIFDSYFALGVIYSIKIPDDSLARQFLRRALLINPRSEAAKSLLDAKIKDSIRKEQNENL